MGYKNTIKLLELELKALREEVHTLRKTIDILERQHSVETKYGGYILSFSHKSAVPKVKTRKGEVEYEDLVKFVIDNQPIEFVDEYCERINCTRTRTLMPDGLVMERIEKRIE